MYQSGEERDREKVAEKNRKEKEVIVSERVSRLSFLYIYTHCFQSMGVYKIYCLPIEFNFNLFMKILKDLLCFIAIVLVLIK